VVPGICTRLGLMLAKPFATEGCVLFWNAFPILLASARICFVLQ